jgi:hypothetical protein
MTFLVATGASAYLASYVEITDIRNVFPRSTMLENLRNRFSLNPFKTLVHGIRLEHASTKDI